MSYKSKAKTSDQIETMLSEEKLKGSEYWVPLDEAHKLDTCNKLLEVKAEENAIAGNRNFAFAKKIEADNKLLEAQIAATNKLVDDLFAHDVINIENYDKLKEAINGVELTEKSIG